MTPLQLRSSWILPGKPDPYGDRPMITLLPGTDSDWERFDRNCSAIASGCVEWTARTNAKGYGCFHLAGKEVLAHRVAFWRHGIAIPKGFYVDHICRNRACVNLEHLRFVDAQTNALENSVGPAAQNARKTHCPQGHPYSGYNLKVQPGKRRCRRCQQIYQAQWARQKRAARKQGVV